MGKLYTRTCLTLEFCSHSVISTYMIHSTFIGIQKRFSKSIITLAIHTAITTYRHSSHVGNGSGQLWTALALSDLVNHPLISEIAKQSAQLNEQPCSTIR